MVNYQIAGTPEGEEVIATENGSRLGRLMYEFDGRTCNVTYLYVEPGERRTGIATMLMLTLWDRVLKHLRSTGSMFCFRAKWTIWSHFLRKWSSRETTLWVTLSRSGSETCLRAG